MSSHDAAVLYVIYMYSSILLSLASYCTKCGIIGRRGGKQGIILPKYLLVSINVMLVSSKSKKDGTESKHPVVANI